MHGQPLHPTKPTQIDKKYTTHNRANRPRHFPHLISASHGIIDIRKYTLARKAQAAIEPYTQQSFFFREEIINLEIYAEITSKLELSLYIIFCKKMIKNSFGEF